jgi:hypothetical protein
MASLAFTCHTVHKQDRLTGQLIADIICRQHPCKHQIESGAAVLQQRLLLAALSALSLRVLGHQLLLFFLLRSCFTTYSKQRDMAATATINTIQDRRIADTYLRMLEQSCYVAAETAPS